MNLFLGIVIGIFILMFLVVAHEFGHFIMARKSGVKVNEFGIGFPPRLIAWIKKSGKWQKLPKSEWQKPQKDLIFSLNALPIGGFCSLDGETNYDTAKGTFGAANFWSKTKILFGGVLMNWLVAFILLTILSWIGMPQFMEHQFYLGQDATKVGGGVKVAAVVADSPAAKAGFMVGDQIIRAGDTAIDGPQDVTAYGDEHNGKIGTYTVLRDGREEKLEAKLNKKADQDYVLGVSMSLSQSFVRSTWSAPIVGFGTMVQLTGETFRGLGDLVWNLCSGIINQLNPDASVREAGRNNIATVGDSVSGPVGIIGVIFPAFANTGINNLMFLAALISVSLACMNILPIPALDGGRWLLIAIAKLRGKPFEKATEEKIISRAFIVLLILIVIITILDIMKL